MRESGGRGRESIPEGAKPFSLVTMSQFRVYLDTFGIQGQAATLVAVEGGYRLHFHAVYGHQKTNALRADKSSTARVFKTVEAAMNVVKAFGFSSLTVEL